MKRSASGPTNFLTTHSSSTTPQFSRVAHKQKVLGQEVRGRTPPKAGFLRTTGLQVPVVVAGLREAAVGAAVAVDPAPGVDTH